MSKEEYTSTSLDINPTRKEVLQVVNDTLKGATCQAEAAQSVADLAIAFLVVAKIVGAKDLDHLKELLDHCDEAADFLKDALMEGLELRADGPIH